MKKITTLKEAKTKYINMKKYQVKKRIEIANLLDCDGDWADIINEIKRLKIKRTSILNSDI